MRFPGPPPQGRKRGTAVIEIKSGRLEAQRGENLPLTALDLTALDGQSGLAPA